MVVLALSLALPRLVLAHSPNETRCRTLATRANLTGVRGTPFSDTRCLKRCLSPCPGAQLHPQPVELVEPGRFSHQHLRTEAAHAERSHWSRANRGVDRRCVHSSWEQVANGEKRNLRQSYTTALGGAA
ncbi:hypothetical protein B0T26DRAFT_527759 [Lasiosphaeria miniovina]|uniref:Secreted protein n=1 Tax=Lasiosphaeria miniovina TaxID=1954250 RepID=A0AA39ZQI3_9PEZI|nr:uncharacterized protein B0T26DRAFT_527759 [Lasiosphaeria miniovina]KAK0701698.1 hypothetical protein B0T26DRAFT_527759 [Lasiosphaeria miniovina]